MAHRRKEKDQVRARREAERGAIELGQRKRILVGVGVIGLVIVLVAALVVLPSGPTILAGAPAVGQPAYDFALVDINGETFQLSGQLGHPVLIDFMGSNCPTCVAEMPELRSVFSAYSSRGLVMISIDVGGALGTQDPEVARNFMSTNGGSWPIALDRVTVGVRYGVVSLPTLYVIDPSGVVAYRNAGTTSAATLSGVISAYV